jgi:hypothetical protein
MGYSEQCLGERVMFLLPSLKLKSRQAGGKPAEERLHRFLLQNFGGYTAAAGNIFGYWSDDGGESYGEHRAFTVALATGEKGAVLKQYLAGLARDLDEKSIYVEIAGRGFLISPDTP